MALTYESTGSTQIIVIERDSDGTQRVARAVQDVGNPRQWAAQLEHPSGNRPCSNIYGTRGDASLALVHYLHSTESDWKQEKARGHRRPEPTRDTSRRVDEAGNYIGSDVSSYLKS